MLFFSSKPFRVAELLIFMLGVPLLLWLALPSRAILPAVWGMALLCYVIARRVDPHRLTGSWNIGALSKENLSPMLARFAVCAVLMLVATYLLKPVLLFSFVREKPLFWALVMVLYPLISVIAQEIVFRRYIFARYADMFSATMLAMVSAVAFGFAHVVFNNWVAPVLCVVGGVIFAQTYHKTRSLALVCLEHALYGNFVFTVGLGGYFYHGAVGAAH